ncbi:MAG TPA: major capsid protein [Candidatus Limnocylindrales bacterium]
MPRTPVDFSADLARLDTLTADQLTDLQTRIRAEFEAADADDDVEALDVLAGHLDRVRAVAPSAPPVAESEPEQPAEPPADPAPAEPEKPAEPTPVVPEDPPAEQPPAEAPAPDAPAATTPSTVTVQEALPVAASATTVPEDAKPVVAAAKPRVFAGADIPGYTAGYEFTDNTQFTDAYAKRVSTLMGLRGGDGEQIVIASIKLPEVDDSRLLDMGDWRANMEKIEAVTDPNAFVQPEGAITAAGGCCAPLVTRYELWDNGGVTDRPVRDALAGFRANRGGIRFFAGPALADVQGSLGFWTCADDTAADASNTSTWKVCGRINCPPEQTAELQAITLCLTFGVLQTRIFPELAAANVKLANVAQARLADSALLAQIKAGSTAVTDSGTAWGAVRDLMNTVGRASMYYRDRYRIKSAPLRVILPSWIIDALRTDLLDGPDWGRDFASHYGVAEATIREFFSNRNLNVTFALDSAVPATNGGGFFAAISGAALPAWPTTVEWAMFPEGAWLFLDGGQLDLGVVRDSTLVRTNDYMTFSETFEAAAKIGGESLWITSTIDVSGKYPAAV